MAEPALFSLITSAAPAERQSLTPRCRVTDPVAGRLNEARWARCSHRGYYPAKHARFSHAYDLGHGRYNWAFFTKPYRPLSPWLGKAS